MKNYLDKSIARIPSCDQVTELDELTELTTLHKTLNIIFSLMYNHFLGWTYIHMIGGIESVVKKIKTFPKCLGLCYRHHHYILAVVVVTIVTVVTGDRDNGHRIM
jgi:hypothetical protein